MTRTDKNGQLLPSTRAFLSQEIATRILKELDSGKLTDERRDDLYDKLIALATFKPKKRKRNTQGKKNKKKQSPSPAVEKPSDTDWGKKLGGG